MISASCLPQIYKHMCYESLINLLATLQQKGPEAETTTTSTKLDFKIMSAFSE